MFAQALALVAVFGAEFALFGAATGRHYAWVYPRWFDQQQYLQEAYGAFDRAQAEGFMAGARHALGTLSPQGSLHGFLALLAFSAAGPSRNAALAINLLSFIALQGAMFIAVKRISGSFPFAWASVGILAAMHSPWSDSAGSATDFRLDWMAACAYGVALAAAVCGQAFRSTKWAVVFGVSVGIALLVRHLEAVYFGVIYLTLLGWLLTRPSRRPRCARLVLSGACAAGVSAWAFWRSRHNIYTYYWLGQFVGPERALRESQLGFFSRAKWIASELLFQQLGIAGVLLAVAGMVFLAFGFRRRGANDIPGKASGKSVTAIPVVVAFLVAPTLVLLVHPEKSPQTLNIMIPAIAWVILLPWIRIGRLAIPGVVTTVCVISCVAGELLFAVAQLTNPFDVASDSEFRSINGLSDYIYFRAEEAGLSRPRVAVTQIFDGINAVSLEIVGRERHAARVRFVATLPNGLLQNDPADVMERLAGSDFVCLVTKGPREWPFDREMELMRPELEKWCKANLRHTGDVETAEISVSLYERPNLLRHGNNGVDLASMIAGAHQEPAFVPPKPPKAPIMTTPSAIFWSTQGEIKFTLRAAYSPVRFHATALPEGISLDPVSGEIRGHFHSPGKFGATIVAENAVGSTKVALSFLVGEQEKGATVMCPSQAPANVPITIEFNAFDSRGGLNFIDVNDLTTARFVTRLAANDDERLIWDGSCQVTFAERGEHRLKLRFVSYEGAGGGTYTFIDRDCVVAVAP